jgi:hypothetical protein
MNLDHLNRWIALGANVGVVVGLALLIVEIRQNSELVRAQIHQSRSDNYVSERQAVADSEFILPVTVKLMAAGDYLDPANLDVLDATERERFRRYLQSRHADYDNLFYQYRLGYLDESFYQSRVAESIKRLLPMWEELGLLDYGTPEFRQEIERIAAE